MHITNNGWVKSLLFHCFRKAAYKKWKAFFNSITIASVTTLSHNHLIGDDYHIMTTFSTHAFINISTQGTKSLNRKWLRTKETTTNAYYSGALDAKPLKRNSSLFNGKGILISELNLTKIFVFSIKLTWNKCSVSKKLAISAHFRLVG
jgi:hypothetical protein